MEKVIRADKLSQYKNDSKINDIVNDLIPIGATLLGGSPKCGKTLLAMQLANAIASNTSFLDFKTKQGVVVYLAFEDTLDSIKSRFEIFNQEANENLFFHSLIPDSLFDLIQKIDEIINKYSSLVMIVVDTFALARNVQTSEKYSYHLDYNEINTIRERAIKNNVAIILICHVKKEISGLNPSTSIIGSRGLTAGADAILVMLNNEVDAHNAILYVNGKNIPIASLSINNQSNLVWGISNQEVELEIDTEIAKIINYITKVKVFDGAAGELCSILNINSYPNTVSKKLNKYINLMEENGVSLERSRTGKARTIKLSYKSNTNDDMTIDSGD